MPTAHCPAKGSEGGYHSSSQSQASPSSSDPCSLSRNTMSAAIPSRFAISTRVSSGILDAQARSRALYRNFYRAAPEICAIYALDVPPSLLHAKFRTQFEKHRHISDLAVLDVLLLKAQQEYQETINAWKQLPQVMKWFAEEELEKPSTSYGPTWISPQTIQADLDRFRRHKVVDFKEMMIAFAKMHRDLCRQKYGLIILGQAGASTTDASQTGPDACRSSTGPRPPSRPSSSSSDKIAKGEAVQVTREVDGGLKRAQGQDDKRWWELRADALASNRDWEGLWAVGTGQEVFVNRCMQDETDKSRLVAFVQRRPDHQVAQELDTEMER
ncbi:unnamed protein product [Tilletia caries]|uniref:NADH dehydrogenase [ubiquinone] 1 alpha subcomplex subunit 6 n=1 Tax=Tilletia caries TaxID=13290 RepID=A0ABN7J110_9BASI|nr:unnamed protein product [Tilletia caries]